MSLRFYKSLSRTVTEVVGHLTPAVVTPSDAHVRIDHGRLRWCSLLQAAVVLSFTVRRPVEPKVSPALA